MNQGKIAFIFIILIAIWTVYYVGYTKGIAPINSLRKNKVYTTAIITDETFMVKGRNYYETIMFINSKFQEKNMKDMIFSIETQLYYQEILYELYMIIPIQIIQ